MLQVAGTSGCVALSGPNSVQVATSFQYLDVAVDLIWASPSQDSKGFVTIGADTYSPQDLSVCRVENSDGSYSAGGLPVLPALLCLQSGQVVQSHRLATDDGMYHGLVTTMAAARPRLPVRVTPAPRRQLQHEHNGPLHVRHV